jgi:hypothetical protein
MTDVSVFKPYLPNRVVKRDDYRGLEWSGFGGLGDTSGFTQSRSGYPTNPLRPTPAEQGLTGFSGDALDGVL